MNRWLFAIGFCLCIGCGRASSEPASTAATPAGSATTPGNPSAGAVEVQILNYDGIKKLIESNHGKVVVVDVWSTSCPECVQTFPEFVALQQRIGPEKLACISLSLDFEGVGKPETRLPDVQKFLSERAATFDNVLASEADDVICKKMEIPAPPAVFVFDRDGNVKQRFLHAEKPGETVYQEVGRLVDQLLK